MRFQRKITTTVCLTLIFLLSCTTTKSGHEQNKQIKTQTYVFECQGDYSFVAEVNNEHVWLFLPQTTIKLPHVSSGSGAKYSDGNVLFWNKGEQALLELSNEKYHGCINNRAKAIWEGAKLNGWDFRAVGNEPGWHLLISKDNKIIFVSGYGRERYEFSTPEPLSNQMTRTTKYHVQENGQVLELILNGTKCSDTMSGESFETKVTVILDGKKFNGCGRALH